jgi:hypothetical protein
MATVKGQAEVSAMLAKLPDRITRVLRGAVREAANVVAEDARQRCADDLVRAAIKVTVPQRATTPGRAVARIEVKGKGAFIGPWLEYGTTPHIISVKGGTFEGKGVRQLNREAKEPSLVIGGHFVGPEVQHPGARPEPFLRPAMDAKEAAARDAAQAYINKRFGIGGDQGVGADPSDAS